jgi:hypothetical protein
MRTETENDHGVACLPCSRKHYMALRAVLPTVQRRGRGAFVTRGRALMLWLRL